MGLASNYYPDSNTGYLRSGFTLGPNSSQNSPNTNPYTIIQNGTNTTSMQGVGGNTLVSPNTPQFHGY